MKKRAIALLTAMLLALALTACGGGHQPETSGEQSAASVSAPVETMQTTKEQLADRQWVLHHVKVNEKEFALGENTQSSYGIAPEAATALFHSDGTLEISYTYEGQTSTGKGTWELIGEKELKMTADVEGASSTAESTLTILKLEDGWLVTYNPASDVEEHLYDRDDPPADVETP